MSRLFLGAVLFGSMLVIAAPARGEEAEEFDAEVSSPVNPQRSQPRDDSWYYQPSSEPTSYQPNPLAIIHQKALARSQQRTDRLAALNWYGMSNSRPTAAPTPFCTLYSPAWQSPGGKPFSWYTSGRPIYIFR